MTVGERNLTIRFQQLAHGFEIPRKATTGSAGCDLQAAIEGQRQLEVGARALIPCGFCLEIPLGWEGQVRPRSGLALRSGLTVLNSPGTIDSDYRGEVGVVLINHGSESVKIERGDRIAQLVFSPVGRAEWLRVEELAASDRGTGGFGSTGR